MKKLYLEESDARRDGLLLMWERGTVRDVALTEVEGGTEHVLVVKKEITGRGISLVYLLDNTGRLRIFRGPGAFSEIEKAEALCREDSMFIVEIGKENFWKAQGLVSYTPE